MKFKIITTLSVVLLACIVVSANATIFNGSATGAWSNVDAANPYNGDGNYDPPNTAAVPGYGEDIYYTFNNDGGPLPADSASFQWGLTETAAGLYPTPTHPNRNEFKFNGVGSDGNLGQMDTDNPALNPFLFGTFDYFNGSTYYSSGVNGVTLDLQFYLEDFLSVPVGFFSMQMEFEIENVSNYPVQTPDNVHLLNGQSLHQSFTSGGKMYRFDILGFSVDGGLTIKSQFSSPEGQMSGAGLYAQLNEVPEPATLLLFGFGFAGLFATKMRKRNK